MIASEYIKLEGRYCHNCMKCVRVCPTNAMTYVHHEPIVSSKECILCGKCYITCKHDAKSLKTEFKDVLKWLDNKEKVILSVAPSFAAVWSSLNSLKELLENRGFYKVDETAKGAKVVSSEYMNLIEENSMDNIITTCCPSINTLIEKEYGDLVKYMAPVTSPVITHGRMLKKDHPDSKVVFLTPCIAKYKEIKDERFIDAIDACISMEEVFNWIKDDIKEDEKELWEDFEGSIARLYPTSSGIIATLEKNDNYRYIAVDGIERVRSMLESLRNGQLDHCFIEVNACQGSCMSGPLLTRFIHNEWVGQNRIRDNIDLNARIEAHSNSVDTKAIWKKEEMFVPKYSEEEIEKTLIQMGKTSKARIHDCGACGYDTCRLKAIAVLEGKADPRICLPDALERALSLSNVVLENTPNGIIVLDEEYNVKEINQGAKRLLRLENINTKYPVLALLPSEELFTIVKEASEKPTYFHHYYENYNKIFDHAIVKVANQNLVVIIIMDRTYEIEKERTMMEMRDKTIEVAQKVIDEQMRTVQEIASMLGETTAKSKVALTELQSAMRDNNE